LIQISDSVVRRFFERLWYERHPAYVFLLPLTGLFCALVAIRRWLYRNGIFKIQTIAVPILVIGNIHVGGVGKTPLVIAVVEALRARGRRPGVISRGYGGEVGNRVHAVSPSSDPAIVGDESLLVAQRTGVPIRVARSRVEAAKALVKETDCDCIVADDGLQHYALGRSLEWVVMDAARGLGNGHCLPAGPLRESVKRLQSVDAVIWNGALENSDLKDPPAFALEPERAWLWDDPSQTRPLSDFAGMAVHAVAGIGHPQRFFHMLRTENMKVLEHPFADHHAFRPSDFREMRGSILLTEKDAVKLPPNWIPRPDQPIWVVPVQAKANASLQALLLKLFAA
jgi:tetraacyldisaccharide 4'-kinase